jgi:hypothetical protein
MISVYYYEGCGKTQTEINDTMPHTWIVWVYAQSVHSRIAIQEMSAIRSSFSLENFHIFIVGLRKHFQYVCNQMITRTKLENIFQTNNTQRDIVYKKLQPTNCNIIRKRNNLFGFNILMDY